MESLKEQIVAWPQPSYIQVCRRYFFPRLEPSDVERCNLLLTGYSTLFTS